MSKNRARKRLVNRAVQRVVQRFLASLAEILANPIENDDGVVKRVTDDGEDSGDDSKRYLEMHELEECQGRENVVTGGNERGNAKAPLETNREIDGRYKERQQHRDDRVAPELVANARSDGFGANHSNFAGAVLLNEYALNFL